MLSLKGVMNSIPGQGTNKIPYATWHGQKKKKKVRGEGAWKYPPPETWETTIGSHGFLEQTQEQRPP